MNSMLTGARRLLRPGVALPALALTLGLGLVPSSAVGSSAAAAADPIYVKIDGIPGESKSSKHANEIEISSFQWGVARPVDSSTGLSTGKVKFNPFTITKTIDRASPLFFQAAAQGTKLPTVTLTLNRGGATQLDYLTITLTDVLVTSYQLGSGGDNPAESVSFSFGKIEMSYQPQKSDGSLDAVVKAGWNVKANVKA